jgi:hypothetical protein
MSAETATHEDPLAPDSCAFCNSENMTLNSSWTRVDSYSHDGSRTTVIECYDCHGRFIERERGNKRATTMDDMTLASAHWDIPEGYCLTVCDECGAVVGKHEWVADNRELLRQIQTGELTSDCCGARGRVERDWYDVPVMAVVR